MRDIRELPNMVTYGDLDQERRTRRFLGPKRDPRPQVDLVALCGNPGNDVVAEDVVDDEPDQDKGETRWLEINIDLKTGSISYTLMRDES